MVLWIDPPARNATSPPSPPLSLGMPGQPGMAFPGPVPDGAAAASSGGGGGFFSSLFGGGEQAPAPAPVTPTDLSEDPFQPPPMPKEFVMGGDGDGSFKH